MKKMKIRIALYWLVLSVMIVLSGCEKENNEPTPLPPEAGYSTGVFIINEGPFQTGTGTINYLDRFNSGTQEKVFQFANDGIPLGNIVQSMNVEPVTLNAYIAVNNANKIEVVDLNTFISVQTIENIPSPRYIEFGNNGKAYISSWDNTVKVLSTEGFEFFGQIPVGQGPEKMQRVGNTIWVLNQGGFSVDSTITIISTATDEVVTTLQVYPKPTGIQVDENGMVWVMCSGKGWNGFPGIGDSEGHLLCINPENYNFIKDIQFPEVSMHPEKLVINREGDQLYYNYVNGIYRFDTNGNELDQEPLVNRGSMFYGLGLDPEENLVYASDPLDFSQNGWVFRYDANNGNLKDSLQAGIAPGEFYFTKIADK